MGKLVKSRLIYSKFSRIKALDPAKPHSSSWREATSCSHPAAAATSAPAAAQDAEPPLKLGCVSILVM